MLNKSEATPLAELGMIITKASRDKETGTMRLRLVNSDTGSDVFGEKMSLELFTDFVERSTSNAPIPEPFKEIIEKSEQGWYSGGPPYLSIAHYKSGGGKNVPGEQESLYIDGEKLKSVDILYPNSLGNAVWSSVYKDLNIKDRSEDDDLPVRVSIGFLDLEHKHEGAGEDGEDIIFTRSSLDDRCELCAEGIGDKIYLKGHLVHKAFTRVPANERTLVEVEMTEKSIGTKKEDARSIIGDEADLLDEKSQVAEILVVKADEDESRDPEPLEVVMENEQEELVVEEPVAEVPEVVEEPQVEEPVIAAPVPVAEPVKSKIDTATDALKAKMEELTAKGIYGDAALKELQPFFNEMGDVVKEEVTPKSPLGDIAGIIKSAISDMVPALKEQIVTDLMTQLGGLVQTKPTEAPVSDRPAARSVIIPRSNPVELQPQGQKQLSQIEMIARKSTGLSE